MLDHHKYLVEKPFELESGAVLPSLEIAYTTYGRLSASGDNVVWICHALTGNAEPTSWWSGLVGPGKLFDPENHYIICANMLGSCYGSSGPLSVNPETGRCFRMSFPIVTIRDCVRAFADLRQHLQLPLIDVCIGGSTGGQVALEWAIIEPDVIRQSIVIAASAVQSPWSKALNAAQRMAIEADSRWLDDDDQAGTTGLKAARAIGMISYRNYEAFAATQQDGADFEAETRASSYLRHQGDKLAQRFNAQAYWLLTKTTDSHHIGRGRGECAGVLKCIRARTLIIGINSDILFPLDEQKFIAEHISEATLRTIDSKYGHDGFLVEYPQLTSLIGGFLRNNRRHSSRRTRAGMIGCGTVGSSLYQRISSVPSSAKNPNEYCKVELPPQTSDPNEVISGPSTDPAAGLQDMIQRNKSRIPCALFGGSGLVGQAFAWLLARHPWFEVVTIAASERHVGQRYADLRWRLPVPPTDMDGLTMVSLSQAIDESEKYRIAFSALPADIALAVETGLRKKGVYVFSNSSALRMEPDVPIIIPEVNPEAADMIEAQGFPTGGFVITNPNCVVAGLALALAPLRRWNLQRITVTACQSLSGAGLRGPAAIEMTNNIIPFIFQEEAKIVRESKKILNCDIDIGATCMRVPVSFGHLVSVWAELDVPVTTEEVIDAFNEPCKLEDRLPTLPEHPITVNYAEDLPQPSMCFGGQPEGMQVFVGRIEVRQKQLRFVLLVNNLVRGAAGGSISNAELFIRRFGGSV